MRQIKRVIIKNNCSEDVCEPKVELYKAQAGKNGDGIWQEVRVPRSISKLTWRIQKGFKKYEVRNSGLFRDKYQSTYTIALVVTVY